MESSSYVNLFRVSHIYKFSMIYFLIHRVTLKAIHGLHVCIRTYIYIYMYDINLCMLFLIYTLCACTCIFVHIHKYLKVCTCACMYIFGGYLTKIMMLEQVFEY